MDVPEEKGGQIYQKVLVVAGDPLVEQLQQAVLKDKYIRKNASRSEYSHLFGPTEMILCFDRIWHRAITRNR